MNCLHHVKFICLQEVKNHLNNMDNYYLSILCRPPVGWGSTYCFTDVRVGVSVGVGVGVSVGVGVTPITKGTPAQIFFGRHVFCCPGHWLSNFAMTLTFALKVKP